MEETNKDTLTYDQPDVQEQDPEKTLIDEMKKRFEADKKEIDELITREEMNARLYFAEYIDKDKLATTEADDYMMVPKLFSNLETVIPIVTRKSPEYIVDAYPQTKRNKRYANLLRRDIEDKWQMSEMVNGWQMQPKQQENIRNLFTQHVLIWEVYWNVEENRMCVEPVQLKDIVAPLKKCRTVYELPYIMRKVTEPLRDVIARFPDKAEDLKEALPNKSISEDSIIEYWRYWKNESVAYWYKGTKDVVLGMDDNPYWNREAMSEETAVAVPAKNHFKRPCKPFIIDTDLRKGNGLVGVTSMIKVNESAVRALDTDKNQIRKNLRMSNGLVVVAEDRVGDKEESAKLDFSGRKVLTVKGDSVEGAVDIKVGRAVDTALITSMDDNKNIMDETTGAYASVRGEREGDETLGGRQILKQSALTRNEPLFQLMERNAQDIGNWYAQFICVFGDTPQVVYSASTDSSKVEKISKKIYEGDVEYIITVKDGSTTPIDKKAIQAQAWDETTNGIRSFVDYYRAIEAEDPEGMARRAILQQNDPMALIQPQGDVDVEAIMHIESIILGRDVPLFSNPDPEKLAQHLQTHARYKDGEDIDENLDVSYEGLENETKMVLDDHYKQELELLKQMKMQMEQDAMLQQQSTQLAGQGIDPTAVAAAQQLGGGMAETPISQPSQDVSQAPQQPSEAELAGM